MGWLTANLSAVSGDFFRIGRSLGHAWLKLFLGSVAFFLLTAKVCLPAETNSVTGPAVAPPFAAHLAQVRQSVPAGFAVIAQPPFVVIGDEPPAILQTYATQVVKWTVDRIKLDYFERDPVDIIDIWLFRDHNSYLEHTRDLFHITPSTPFGFYSAEHHALIMDISTGGGTLVHEIVHPFMAANFTNCPAWFNEGLASLYEQSSDANGHIYGLVNWRYTGLVQAIKDGKILTFKQLTATTDNQFYNGGGTNYSEHYAQARYLCYYLQEKGLLVKFYHEFRDHAKQDPTGYATLQRVLGETDMAAFQKKWEKFVLALPPP